jgi:hypothetical protein
VIIEATASAFSPANATSCASAGGPTRRSSPTGCSAWTKTAAPSDFAAAKNGSKRGYPIETAIHIGADFDALEATIRHQTLEFADGQIRVLERHTAQAGEEIWLPLHHLADCVVDVPAQ